MIEGNQSDISDEDIIARMMVPMVNEVARCLEENIIASPAEADIALVYGIGFPPFRGGAFRYVDTLGVDHYVAMADKFSDLGALYHVPTDMKRRAGDKQAYFDVTPVNAPQSA